MRRSIIYIATVVAVAFPVIALAQWTSAPANPPASNVSAPINVGGDPQQKVGGLQVGSFISDGGAVVSGNLGVGTNSPQAKTQVMGTFFVNSNTDATGGLYYGGADNGLIIGNYASTPWPGTNGLYIAGSTYSLGSMYAPAFFYSSDRTLKTNIATLPDALSRVMSLRGVSFDWKDTGRASVGVIAQEVEQVYPELVSTDATTGKKTVEYGNLVAPLIEAVKAQQQQIDALRAEIHDLKATR